MSEYRLLNTSIFEGEDCIFITGGDHKLTEVTGSSVKLITEVIEAFEKHADADVVFENVKSAYEEDRDFFNDTIQWLETNKIIEDLNKSKSVETKVINTYISTLHLTETDKDKVLSKLSDDHFKYLKTENKDNSDLIIVVSPIFERFDDISKLNEWAYEHKIPVCHVGIDDVTITLGPITSPKRNTPCLLCYSKRKISNLRFPNKTIKFIQFSDKKKLTNYNIAENPYFFNVLITYLKKELEKFFITDGFSSSIIGKSVVFDNYNLEITKSRILKIPGCPVCNKELLVAPLNG